MKKIVFLMFFVMVITVIVFCSTAHAEIEKYMRGRTFVKDEVTRINLLNVPNVPEELTNIELIDKLISGKLERTIVMDSVGKKNFRFTFPPSIKSWMEYKDKPIKYLNGEWLPIIPVSRIMPEQNEIALSILWLWVMASFVLAISVASLLLGASIKELLCFYIATFISVFVGIFTYKQTGNEILSLFMGAIVPAFAGTFLFKREGVGATVCGIVGGLAGGLTGKFTNGQNYEMVLYYYIFLFMICIASFGIAQLVRALRRQATNAARMTI